MSLGAGSQRSAYANLISNLDSESTSKLKLLKGEEVLKIESEANNLYDYFVSDDVYDFLTKKGIPLSNQCFRVHSHPASKIIENYFLFGVLSNHVVSNSIFISLKESKLIRLGVRKANLKQNVNLVNRLIHAKDSLRYADPIRNLDFTTLDSEMMGKLKTASRVFVHDEIHYWSLVDFQNFLGLIEGPLLYTIIYPPEVHLGYESSLHPELYEFRYIKDRSAFIWAPDGNYGASYTQPVNPWLLSTNKLHDSDGRSWTLTKLETIGSHHLFLCVPGSRVVEDQYIFTDFTLVDPRLFSSYANRNPRLRASFVRRTAHYLMALKKADSASAVSKLRQLSKSDETADEILFVGGLAKCISELKYFNNVSGLLDLGEVLKNTFEHMFLSGIALYLVDKQAYHMQKMRLDLKNLVTPTLVVSCSFKEYKGRKAGSFTKMEDYMDQVFLGELTGEFQPQYAMIPMFERDPYCIVFEEGKEVLEIPKLERECCRFKQMLGRPKVEEQRPFYSAERPTDSDTFVYMETLPKYFMKVMLIGDGEAHTLYDEGLIDAAEYIRRCQTANSTSTEVVQEQILEALIDEEVPVEEQMELGSTLEAVTEAKKNLCLLKPLAEHLKIDHPILVGHMVSIDSSFARFLNDDGLGLPGLLMIAAAKNMTLSISRKGGGYVHIDGDFNPLGIEITGNHATLVPYERLRNDPKDMLKISETCGSLMYTVRAERAMRLVTAFKKGFTGVMLNEFLKKWERVESRVSGTHELTLSSFLGFAGCGKTTFLLKMLKCNTGMTATVVSPRRNLADEWAKDLEGTSHNVYTFEKYLKGASSCDLLVIDECGLYPPGYIDLVYFMKEFKHVVILGDPLQCSYYNEKDNILLKESAELFKELTLPTTDKCVCGLTMEIKEYTGPSFSNEFGTGDKLNGRDAWFYSRGGEGYTYSKISHSSRGWDKELDQVILACGYEPSMFDHCLAQEYTKGGKIGFHSDDEKCYPIDNPILTVQLDGACHFSISCKKGSKTFSIDGPKFFLMKNGMQRSHKHAVEADKPRASLTFRSTKPLQLSEPIEENVGCPYMMFTNRLSRKNSIFGVKAHGTGGFEVKEINTLNQDLPTICFCRDFLEKKKEMKEIMTVSQSQGLSRKLVQLVLDTGSISAEDTNVITALTRARNGIHIFYDVPKGVVLGTARSRVLKSFLKQEVVDKKMLMLILSEQTKLKFHLLEENNQIGSTRAEIEEKLAGDPGLKAMLTILDAEEMEEELMEPEVCAEVSRTHLALSEFRNELFPTELKAKEDREAHIHNVGFSNQIRDDVPTERVAGPYGPSSIYLHHKSEDDVTFILSIRKRLRFADYEKNSRALAMKGHIGEQIFEVFSRRIGLGHVPQVDQTETDLLFTQKRIEKSAALLEAHSIRSDADWPSNIIKIFIKNQCCTKMEKRGIEAKAGQTIACFAHAVLCRFGPLLRKTELQFRKMIPEHILIFSQKNYDDLDHWAKDYFLDFTGTDSDYEAFDRSQDATILGFERSFLRYFDWPEEMINEYVELKLRMGGALGDLAIMRFSGEFGTFFFNTICNMAFTYLRYKIGPYQPLAFAGDDMVAPGKLEVDMTYHDLLSLLQLKAKVNYSDQPLFCGWRLSPFGIVKDPNLLLDRLEMKRAEGTLELCIANYALEASYGYKLSDHLHLLNIDLDAYQELVRKIIKLKCKLPLNISALYSAEEDIISDGEG
uniref:ORF1 protein n=1 Tax=Grapevine virus G TaxID=2022475 RepID=A0A291EU89_9VIRU|nr:replicase [Grapevine virus G]